ncbi:MAG TPA: ABC transporter permease [Gemmatimonadaceae bacterium]
MKLNEIWNRLAFWSRRERLDRELAAELEAHIDLLARDCENEGMSPADARAAARRRLGNVSGLREGSRDYWGFPAIEMVLQDVRYALRGLRRAPGFTATVVLTLGLGIGANAAMFGVVDRLMYRPVAMMRDPASVNRVYLRSTYRGSVSTDADMEYARYLDLRRWTSSFSQFAGFAQRQLAVGTGSDVQQVYVSTVNAEYFDFFDARAALGRFFTAAEDSTPRGAEVGVLGYNYWKLHYGGDSSVIGSRVNVDNFAVTIIGVAPKGFTGVQDVYQSALYIPITTYAGSRANRKDATEYYTHYNWGWMEVMARRKPNVTVAAASADLTQAYVKSWNAEGLQETVTPPDVAKPTSIAGPIRVGAGPDPSLEARTSLWTIGVAGIVLLIACANVANLFLARALRRRREIAMRIALGSSRARLAAQAITESVLLAGAGGIVGVVIAHWGGSAMRTLFVSGDAQTVSLVDWRMTGFAFATALFAGVVTGAGPAVLSGRGELAPTLKAGAREGNYQRSRLRTALLVSQGALSVLLLVTAGLFVRSLQQARAIRIGFDADPVLIADVNARGTQIGDTARLQLGKRLESEARAIPGVEAATWVSSLPFVSSSSTGLYVTGIDTVRKLGRFTYNQVTPDYFRVMDTRIVRGRSFTDADRGGAPLVAVVSENMAKTLWPGRDALGQCMRVGQDTMPCTTVVGIAENAAQRALSNDPELQYYLAADQYMRGGGLSTLLVRAHGDPAKLADVMRKRLQTLMPGASYITTELMRDVVDQQRRAWQAGATIFLGLGVLALIVAAVGTYGVISYNVTQRMHELGVRIALGAQTKNVVGLVVTQGITFAMAGVAIGIGLAALVAKWMQPLLFHEPARDPVTYGVVGAMMLLVGVAASVVPSVRATRADPNVVLRSD